MKGAGSCEVSVMPGRDAERMPDSPAKAVIAVTLLSLLLVAAVPVALLAAVVMMMLGHVGLPRMLGFWPSPLPGRPAAAAQTVERFHSEPVDLCSRSRKRPAWEASRRRSRVNRVTVAAAEDAGGPAAPARSSGSPPRSASVSEPVLPRR